MKKNLFKSAFIALASILMLSTVMTSCDPEELEPADTTTLEALIDSCQTIADNATLDDYPQEAITAFNSVLTTAKAALDNKLITQTAVDNLIVQLRAARETFIASEYDVILPSALMMGLSFEEGTGAQLTAAGKGWTAVLKKGPAEIFGTATNFPSFVTGKVGKAMYFNNGSHLQISDYAASDLMGSQLSIAMWVKPDSTRENNYLASYNYWNSWKFQLQLQNKPFFTVHTNADGWVDADNQADFSAPNEVWTHLVVSLNLNIKILTFYVNGVNTMEWNATTKEGLTGTGIFQFNKTLPLLIASGFTYEEGMASMGDEGWWKTVQSFPHFAGVMDEVKIYNIALTDGQVAKLYNEEKE